MGLTALPRRPGGTPSSGGRFRFRRRGGRFRPNPRQRVERRFPVPPEVCRVEMAHHAKFLARTVMVPGGDVELAYRVLTR